MFQKLKQVTLREEQAKCVELFKNTDKKYLCVELPTGCHAIDTEILMADGSTKKIQDIVIGDLVMGINSQTRQVLNLHKGIDEMYRVKPVKGESFIVNQHHMLSMKGVNNGKNFPSSNKSDWITNVSVINWLEKSKSFKHVNKLWKDKVDYFYTPSELLPLDAYFLGAMLGDGSYTTGTPSLHNPDKECYEYCNSYVQNSLGLIANKIVKDKKGNNLSWRYSRGTVYERGTENPLTMLLKQLGLHGKSAEFKHIPHGYKTASIWTRKELLAGLMDTDGSLGNGTYDFISKSRQLAEDICFVARSLGLACNLSKCQKGCQNNFIGTYYRVCISGDIDMIPCKIERKKASPRLQKKRVNVTGFSVEHIGKGEYYGFECDGDHLYLTADFTVHHNSGKSILGMKIADMLIEREINIENNSK